MVDTTQVNTKISARDIRIKKPVNPIQQFLSPLWLSPEQKYQLGTLDRKTKNFRNIPVSSIDEACQLAQKLSDEGSDAYFAMAGYKTSANRQAANASGASCFWIDIDCGEDKANAGKGYLTIADADKALKQFCITTGLPMPTHVVDSGGGLHSYWVLDAFVDRETWLDIARKLKALTIAHGFLADPTRTADLASVLRPPSTFNYKYDPPRPVTLIHASTEPISTKTMLEAIEKAHNALIQQAATEQKPVATQIAKNAGEEIGAYAFSKHDFDQNDSNWTIDRLAAFLDLIDPEEGGRPAWIATGMALHNVTGGSADGLQLFDAWSRRGATYPGKRGIEVQWRSFNASNENRYNIGTIINRVKNAGIDWTAVIPADEKFQVCEFSIVEPAAKTPADAPCKSHIQTDIQARSKNPLDRFSLRGMSDTLSLKIGKETPILGGLALIGQSTFFYAAPNTGKTLITIALLCEDIKAGRIDPNSLYYIDVDDTARGLVEKLSVAEEFGFHMLSEGHNNFKTSEFLGILSDMIEQDQAHGVVIVLDTTKKFADLMDKKKTSLFMSVIRPFVAKGGTVIGMAHTNKNPGSNGKVIYGGTTDLRDDCDCCHTIEVIDTDGHEKTVGFNSLKSRGNVLKQAAYRYTTAPASSYNEILLSVEEINDAECATVKQQVQIRNDSEIIDIVFSLIAGGTNTKMALASAVAIDAKISKNRALKIIERYTGGDLNLHKWQFSVLEHNKKVYAPLAKVTQMT